MNGLNDILEASHAGWVLIEHEGALYRGPGRGNPREIWTADGWQPYAGAGRQRGVEWGEVIDDARAARLISFSDHAPIARK